MQSTTTTTTTSTTVGPRAKCDQVIYEAICKACEIIVGSRSHHVSTGHPSSSTTTTGTTTGTTTATPRFNLQIPEVLAVRHLLSQYRLQLHVPIRLDVYYQHPVSSSDDDGTNTGTNNGGSGTGNVNGNHPGRRELLERWCLEYKSVVSSERFLQTEGYNMVLSKNDPMAQLTHVCKRIVIWLRTLYCWTRLLPAHQLPSSSIHAKHIGFSIYVHTDYTVDDTSDLIQNQGFAYHSSHPHRTGSNGMNQNNNNGLVTTTPYGELSWQVVYCPLSKLERSIPQIHQNKNNSHVVVRIQPPPQYTPRRSQPIPMVTASKNTNNNNYNHDHPELASNFAPRSAPSTQYYHHPSRTTSYTERSQQRMNEAATAIAVVQQPHPYRVSQISTPPPVTGKSFDPNRHRHMLMQHKSDINDQYHQLNSQQQQQQYNLNQHQNHPPMIQRSQTTIGNPSSPLKIQKAVITTQSSTTDKQPERVMSGLSLALLMASNDDDHINNDTMVVANTNDEGHHPTKSIFRNAISTTTNTMNDEGTEIEDQMATLQVQDDKGNVNDSNHQGRSSYQTRRAALHQMPPHLLQLKQQQQQQQQSSVHASINDEGNNTESINNISTNNNAFGDYGYGYNNHIPWQKIHPSQSNPTMAQPHLFVHTNSFGARTSLSTSPTTPMSPIQPHFVANNSNSNSNNNNLYSGRDISPMGGAYFLRSTPSTVGSIGGGGSGGGIGHFIPPRNRSDSMNSRSVTPPFQPRPVGFIQQQDPPTSMFLDPSAATNMYETSNVPSKKTPLKAGSSPPVTSLDSLRSSPFQQSQQAMTLQHQNQPNQQDSRSAMFSSLAAAAAVLPPSISITDGGGIESDYLTAPMSLAPSFLLDTTSSSSMRRSLWGQRSSMGGSGVMPSSLAGLAGRQQHNYLFDEQGNDDYYSEEMPFALEIPTPSILDGSTSLSQQPSKAGAASKAIGASSTFGTSSSLAVLAQKCSVPNQRLKIFDKQNKTASSNGDQNGTSNSDVDDFTNSLAEQLQEFRTFGASLHSSSVILQQHETNAQSNFGGVGDDRNVLTGSGTSSTSTPISLKS